VVGAMRVIRRSFEGLNVLHKMLLGALPWLVSRPLQIKLLRKVSLLKRYFYS
jgi:hypothetical protein